MSNDNFQKIVLQTLETLQRDMSDIKQVYSRMTTTLEALAAGQGDLATKQEGLTSNQEKLVTNQEKLTINQKRLVANQQRLETNQQRLDANVDAARKEIKETKEELKATLASKADVMDLGAKWDRKQRVTERRLSNIEDKLGLTHSDKN